MLKTDSPVAGSPDKIKLLPFLPLLEKRVGYRPTRGMLFLTGSKRSPVRLGNKRVGRAAGYGGRRLRIKGVPECWEHEAIWLLIFQEEPPDTILHRNFDRQDNRFVNLLSYELMDSMIPGRKKLDGSVDWYRGICGFCDQFSVWVPEAMERESFHDTLKEALEVRNEAAICSHGSLANYIVARE